MKKMMLGDVEVTVIEEARGRVLFEHPSGDKFVARRRFLRPADASQTEEKNVA